MFAVGGSVRPISSAKGKGGLDPEKTYKILEVKEEPIIPSVPGKLYTFLRLDGAGGWFISSLFNLA